MRVEIHADADGVAMAVATVVAARLTTLPTSVIGLPTGRTAIPFYQALVMKHRAGALDFSRAATFNLDEFVGIGPRHPGSYAAFMRQHFFDHVNLEAARRLLPNGLAADPGREARRYERRLDALGGLDVAVVGIGGNGHIAFNEPARHLEARTHAARLAPATRRANAYLFGRRLRDVPTHAITMGVGTILQARQIVLMATGAGKRAIVRRALTGPITTAVPASLLQGHPDVLVVLDRPAARGLVVRG